jgi:homoserine kinase
MLGGIVLIRSYHPLDIVSLHVPSKLIVIVIHPNVVVLTKNSRAVLPKNISLKDGIAQWSNTAALVAGLYSENYNLIGRSVNDHVAEPHRASLIPCFQEVKFAAISNGALACTISGSGPSIFALAETKNDADKISKAMQKEFSKKKIKSTAYISKVNREGVKVV